MNNKRVIDYLIVICITLLLVGVLENNKQLNLVSFLALILCIVIKTEARNIKTIKNGKNKQVGILKKSKSNKIYYFKEYMDNWLREDYITFKDEYDFFDNNCCPNCGCILNNKIQASRKCSECKKKIVLRTNKLTSKKMLLSEKRATEYDKHDKKRSEILYFENIIFKRQYIYSSYMNKFYELKSKASNPRDAVYPFVNYVSSQLDGIAYKKYMKIINLSDEDIALESFEVIRQFNLANMQYFLLAEIANYKGKKDIALDTYATAVYRGIQISILDNVTNPYYKFETIDIMGYVFPGVVLKFLKESGYTLEDFKISFLQNRHPFILKQISNEESWIYVENIFELYKNMETR